MVNVALLGPPELLKTDKLGGVTWLMNGTPFEEVVCAFTAAEKYTTIHTTQRIRTIRMSSLPRLKFRITESRLLAMRPPTIAASYVAPVPRRFDDRGGTVKVRA